MLSGFLSPCEVLLGYKHRQDEQSPKQQRGLCQHSPCQSRAMSLLPLAHTDAKITGPSDLKEFGNHKSQSGLKQVKEIISPIIFASSNPGGLLQNQTFLSCHVFSLLHWPSTKEPKIPTHCLPTLPNANEWKVLHVTFLGKTLFPLSATALLNVT